MIKFTFNDFAISLEDGGIPQQYDNLTVPVLFTGDFPAGYTWTMYLAHGNNLDVIDLNAVTGGYGYLLNADQLAFGGVYQVQLYGTFGSGDGAPVKHTNVIAFKVPSSLSGNAHWVEIPTAFTDLKNEMQAIADSITGLTADATVDANTGTPSVTVTESMIDDKIHLDFDFKNLKGDQGEPGVTDVYTREQSDSKYAPVIVSTASGNPATFTDGADNLPIKSLVAELLATQSGSGDPTPNNIRPIIAITACNITANGNVHTIDTTSAGTFYGGKLNATTGELTITHAIFDLGSKSWSYNSSRAYFGRNFDGIKQTASGTMPKMICSGYKAITTRQATGWATAPDFTIGQLNNADTVVVKDSRFTNANSFRAAVSGIYVVYELTTPSVTVQLTPEQINTVLGNNTISCDLGSVSVDYPADTKLYIDDRVNAIMTIIANL